ncbi:MAG TPA: 2-oxo-hepta-3-ene-1,7-dioic acid hydratase [Steroidobacteraceae bacterium]
MSAIVENAVTLSLEHIHAAAEALHSAERNRLQLRQLSLRHPSMRIADAYAVQRAWVDIKLAEGRSLRGHKIGLTSRAMQLASQINEPDYGDLLDDMFFGSGADIPFRRFIAPRVEVELAFVLKRPLSGPDCTLAKVLEATECVMPAAEIIDARIEQLDRETRRPRTVVDTIADNAASAGVVLGDRQVGPQEIDLRWVAALLTRNAVIEDSGVAAAVLNHPGNGVAWLANKLHPHGRSLCAGQVILGGSFTRAVAAGAGDSFLIDYGPLGSIGFRFI